MNARAPRPGYADFIAMCLFVPTYNILLQEIKKYRRSPIESDDIFIFSYGKRDKFLISLLYIPMLLILPLLLERAHHQMTDPHQQ